MTVNTEALRGFKPYAPRREKPSSTSNPVTQEGIVNQAKPTILGELRLGLKHALSDLDARIELRLNASGAEVPPRKAQDTREILIAEFPLPGTRQTGFSVSPPNPDVKRPGFYDGTSSRTPIEPQPSTRPTFHVASRK